MAFVLGAGFSKAISPVMPTLAELSLNLRPQFIELFGHSDWRTRLLDDDFEACMSILAQDQPWLPEPENLRNRAAFLDVSQSLAALIWELQERALADPEPQWLAHLVRWWHDHEAKVLTFNYDTLVEKAYGVSDRCLAPEPGEYSHTDLYPLFLPPIDFRGGSQLVFTPEEAGFRLVKLHGSINWCYSGSEIFYGESIYDIGIEQGWKSAAVHRHMSKSHLALDKVQLLVPPTSTKSAYFTNETGPTRLSGESASGCEAAGAGSAK